MIDQTNIAKVLASDPRRGQMAKISKYYEGDFVPAKCAEVKKDGRAKEICKVNWVRYITEAYSSFVFSEAPSVKSELPLLQDFARKTNRMNIENLENALLYGFGVEIYTDTGQGLEIKTLDPRNTVLVIDEMGNLAALLVESTVQPNTVFNGKLNTSLVSICDVYTPQVHQRYVKSSGWTLVSEEAIDGIPASIFALNSNLVSFFHKDLLNNIDAFNVNRTSLYDQISSNSETIRVLKGSLSDLQAIFSKDKNGVSAYAKMLESGLFTIPKDCEIDDISRNIDITKVETDLRESRNGIYLQAYLPNLEDEISSKGGVSSISGAAMELIYSPMLAQSRKMMAYFDRGMASRFAKYLAHTGMGEVPYELQYIYSVPANKIEYFQYGKLEETLSIKDRIDAIPFVKDKEKALQNYSEQARLLNEETAQDEKETA